MSRSARRASRAAECARPAARAAARASAGRRCTAGAGVGRSDPQAAAARLGALRLGQLGVRDHGDGRVLPGVLPAILESRRRPDRQHLAARFRQRCRRVRRGHAGAGARRDRRSLRAAQALPDRLEPGRHRRHRGCCGSSGVATGLRPPHCSSSARSASRRPTCSTTRCCWTLRQARSSTGSPPSATRSAISAAACCSR